VRPRWDDDPSRILPKLLSGGEVDSVLGFVEFALLRVEFKFHGYLIYLFYTNVKGKELGPIGLLMVKVEGQAGNAGSEVLLLDFGQEAGFADSGFLKNRRP
jgi:hypothetical protein